MSSRALESARSRALACARTALAGMLLILTSAVPAAAQSSDGQCLTGYVCTAGDVGIHEVIVIDTIDPCTGPGDTATVNLRVSFHNNVGGNAYDVGFYLETSGGTVTDPNAVCLHTYLDEPLDPNLVYPTDYGDFDNDVPTGGPHDLYRALNDPNAPFYDADGNSCGDLDALSEAIVEIGPVTIACADQTNDDIVDVSVGFSNRQNAAPCAGIADAIPGTVSKCTAERVNLTGLEVPVELMHLSVE